MTAMLFNSDPSAQAYRDTWSNSVPSGFVMKDPVDEPIRFRVIGTPKGQPRPRAFAKQFGNKFSARVYDPGTAEGWKGGIALAARPHIPKQPLEGPIIVNITFLFPRPKCLMREKDPDGRIPHTAKPDRDNCDKAALDCLKTLGFFVDDAQVFDGKPTKFYVAKDERPGAEIEICKWEGGA